MESFLSIQQVARQVGLTAHTLRYYERIGLIHAVGRDAGGRRRYARADMDWIRFLTRLRDTGMPIADMLRYAAMRRQGADTAPARQALLEAHLAAMQEKIAQLQTLADFVADKVAWYRQAARVDTQANPTRQENDHAHSTTGTSDRPATLRKGAGQAAGD